MHRVEISFEKQMTGSMLPPRSQMTLPRLFVKRHADKVREYVTLRNATNGELWIVKIHVSFCRNKPQVYLYRGWKNFTINNDLVVGDRLAFALAAKSLFDVFILRVRVKPDFSVHKPKPGSQDSSAVQGEKKKSPGPQHDIKISAQGCQKTEHPPDGTSLDRNSYAVARVARLTSDSPAPECPDSDMDSHSSEPMIQPKGFECVSNTVHNSAASDEGQKTLPHFLKRTTKTETLEIPKSFNRDALLRLGTTVQLSSLAKKPGVSDILLPAAMTFRSLQNEPLAMNLQSGLEAGRNSATAFECSVPLPVRSQHG